MELIGFSYPPGTDNDVKSVYVKKKNMEDYVRTGVGVPFNALHPCQNGSFRAGVIESTGLDPETGAMIVKARFDNTMDGWKAYENVVSGKLKQLSVGNNFKLDVNTVDSHDHTIDEISAVEKGDNEEGVDFATDIIAVTKPDDELIKIRDFILDYSEDISNSSINNSSNVGEWDWNTSVDNRNKQVKATLSTMENQISANNNQQQQQQQSVPNPKMDNSQQNIGADTGNTTIDNVNNQQNKLSQDEMFELEQKIRSQIKTETTRATEPTRKRVEELEKTIAQQNKELVETRKRLREEETQKYDENRKRMATVMAKLFTKDSDKKMYQSFEDSLFTPNKNTNLLTDTQKSTITVASVATSALANSMSQLEKHRKLLEVKIIEIDQLKERNQTYEKQLRIEKTLDNSSRSSSSTGFKFQDPNSTSNTTTNNNRAVFKGSDFNLPCPVKQPWDW